MLVESDESYATEEKVSSHSPLGQGRREGTGELRVIKGNRMI